MNNTENNTPPVRPGLMKDEIDLDGDGMINDKEIEMYERRAKNRRRMAWLSLIAMIVTSFCIMFLIPEERLSRIENMLDLYWVSLGGIVGAYVGISAWVNRK